MNRRPSFHWPFQLTIWIFIGGAYAGLAHDWFVVAMAAVVAVCCWVSYALGDDS